MAMCGYSLGEGKKTRFGCGIALQVVGIILASMFCLYFVAGILLDSNIADKVAVTSQAKASELNKIMDTTGSFPTVTYYVYNLTNPDEVVTGAEPIFESVGPYVYWTFIGKAGATYNEDTGTYTSYSQTNMQFQASMSASHDAEITTLDFGYANAFGASSTLTESTLEMLQSCAFASAIHVNLAEAMVLTHYAADIEAAIVGGSTQDVFLASKMGTMTTNYGETIDSLTDMAYAQWGGGAMINDGNDLNGTGDVTTFIDSTTWRGTIAAVLMTNTYLDDTQKATLTAAFAADTDYKGVGIYQFARAMGLPCPRLTINKTKSIIDCFADAANCGLVALATMAVSVPDALTMFGLDAAVTGDLCYASALGAYPGLTASLTKNFWKDRLLLEKGVNNLLFDKKTAKQILEGYNSSTLFSLAMDPAIPSFVYKQSTPELAIAAGGRKEVHGGGTNIHNLNKLIAIDGNVTGYDYDGDGTVTLFGDCYDSAYPPNQKKGDWAPHATSYKIYDGDVYKTCDMKMDPSETFSLGAYSTPVFYRDDVTCFATDAERATSSGYVDVKHKQQVMIFVTPACMYEYTDQKKWKDDCTASKAEHSSYTAIDSISGAPWKFQKNVQLVLGLDGTTADPGSPNAFTVNSQFNVTYRYPLFRAKTETTVRGTDKDTLMSAYDMVFLLMNTLSWVFTGLGVVLLIPAAYLISSALTKTASVQPIATETKEVA